VSGRRRRCRGTALPTAVIAIAVAAAVGVGLTDLVRTEVTLARERVAAASALAVADACAARAVAAVAAGWELDDVLAGPDAVPGTADDGRLVDEPGCRAIATPAPGGPVPARVLADVEGVVPRGRRAVEAMIGRAETPGARALVWLAGGPGGSTVNGSAILDGRGADPPWAALAAPVDAETLDGWLAGLPNLDAGNAAPPRFAAPPPLAALAVRAAAAAPGGTTPIVPSPGIPASAVSFAPADLPLDGAWAGAGVLVVDGVLEVRGSLQFAGVVAATRGIAVRAGAALVVTGAVWAGGVDPLAVAGTLDVRRDDAAVDAADAMLPLPRLPRLLGIRDVG
jgi:hypothetical protein